MTPTDRPSVPLRVAIVGGGLTGLAAANRLLELSRQADRPIDLQVLESSDQPGGLVGTIERDGYLIDTGADSFITNKPAAIALCRRLELEARLQATDARYRGALVLRNGRPYPTPDGFQLLSPSSLWPVLRSPILSWSGKFRLAAEYFVPKKSGGDEESLAAFVRRRFGSEVLDRLVQPLVGGIYTSDPEKLSLAATLPRFIEQEQRHGSLIRAAAAAKSENQADRTSGGARYGLFAGFQGGMRDLVEVLQCSVTAGGTMRNARPVQQVRATPAAGGYELQFAGGQTEHFDAVILTPAAYRIADLIESLDAGLAQRLRSIEYASSAIVVTGHPLSMVDHPLDSFGLVIPHQERRRILAVSFSSRKFPNRAPAGRVLLRTFVGGALQPELLGLDDSAMIAMVQEELQATLGVRGEPDFAQVIRYPRAMPQFHVGHLTRVAEIERLTAAHSGLAIAGHSYHGVGIPDAIHSGEQAAEQVFRL